MAGFRIPQPRMVVESTEFAIPTTRTVPSLDDALRHIARFGGAVASETRTAPGIGSWALVTDAQGNDLVLWENAAQA